MGLFALGKKDDGLGGRYDDVAADDRQVLEAMAAHGANLGEPRHVLHYLYAPDEVRAAAAAGELSAAGWTAEVREPLEGYSDWLVRCERRDYVLSPEVVQADRGTFAAAAARHGGLYDGWEASV